MKKKKRIPILLTFMLLTCFAYSNDLRSNYACQFKNSKDKYWFPMHLIFKNNSYDLFFPDVEHVDLFTIPKDKIKNGYYEEIGTFDIKEEKGLEFIYFNSNSDFSAIKKCGILNYGKLLYLVSGNLFVDSFWVDRDPPTSPYMENYTINSSSFLTEKELKYDGNTFYYDNHSLIPWVEGVKGEGKGEWIEFNFSSTHSEYYSNCVVDAFLISNGYVNYDKPYLYKANNRAKTLRVICEERDIDFTVELEDTSRFRLITLPKNLGDKSCKVRFIIESVYKGEKWNDTVINRIIPISKNYINN